MLTLVTRKLLVTMESPEDRRKAVILLHAEGLSYREIARRINVSISTVSLWVRRYAETGSTRDKPRSGRPHCTTPEEDQVNYVSLPQFVSIKFPTKIFLNVLVTLQ